MATTLAPASTNGFRMRMLLAACFRSDSRSPDSQAGMPQHCRPFTQAVFTSFLSRTSSVSRPIWGSLFWMKQVGNKTASTPSGPRMRPCSSAQRSKVVEAKSGSSLSR